jgi:quercetin dioxygenase-like cupin family protein
MTAPRHGLAALRLFPRPGSRGLRAAALALPAAMVQGIAAEDLAARYGGSPILLDHPTSVALLSLDAHGTIDEHDADHDGLVVIIEGSGFVRVGGPGAQEIAVAAGDAVLWPAHVLHVLWTTDQPMRAIAIEFGLA